MNGAVVVTPVNSRDDAWRCHDEDESEWLESKLLSGETLTVADWETLEMSKVRACPIAAACGTQKVHTRHLPYRYERLKRSTSTVLVFSRSLVTHSFPRFRRSNLPFFNQSTSKVTAANLRNVRLLKDGNNQ